jgi:hypothetical protein
MGGRKLRSTEHSLHLIVDTTLTWKQHIGEIQRKVTKTVNALSNLGGSTWGVTMREMRKSYTERSLAGVNANHVEQWHPVFVCFIYTVEEKQVWVGLKVSQ